MYIDGKEITFYFLRQRGSPEAHYSSESYPSPPSSLPPISLAPQAQAGPSPQASIRVQREPLWSRAEASGDHYGPRE